LFYSLFVCISAYANVYFKTTCKRIRQINIHRYEVHCGSAFEPGGSGLPYYYTPPVCVPAVLGALAAWRLSQKEKKEKSTRPEGTPAMDLELKGIRTHMYTNNIKIESNMLTQGPTLVSWARVEDKLRLSS